MSKRSGMNRQSFSLRRFILQGARVTGNNTRHNARSCDVESGKSKRSSSESKQKHDETHQSSTEAYKYKSSLHASTSEIQAAEKNSFCPICYQTDASDNTFFQLDICQHYFCISCLVKYLKNEINESRTDIACPQCSMAIHPNNIETLLKDCPDFIYKYEDFMIRRYLVADPDSRWCPAPDCSYAVIAAGCASCPQIQCKRPDCGVNFCYHCKAEWHPDQTCDAARSARHVIRTSSISFSHDSHRDEIKPCPRCQVLIVKMNDGSCNHMVCSVCGAEFCWLCMKEVSDLHYLSPSGCTFWGKKPWSRKKKILWQLGTLIGAPVGIALLAGIAVPSMVIGIPVWVGRKLFERYKSTTKRKRNLSVIIGVTASILISPALAGLAIAIGVPILLFYVYGIVPVSLCRAGCASSSSEGFKFDLDDEENPVHMQSDGLSVSAISRIGAASIGDVSISVTSGSQVGMQNNNAPCNLQHFCQESTVALAGSVNGKKFDFQADEMSTESFSAITGNSEKSAINDNFSTKGLAGSLASCKQDTFDKCSVHSNKSFLGCERQLEKEFDTTGKRTILNARLKNVSVHRKLSPDIQNSTNYIPEDVTEYLEIPKEI